MIIEISERKVRGLTVLATGQHVESWVPPGLYTEAERKTIRGKAVVGLLGLDGCIRYVSPEAINSKGKE